MLACNVGRAGVGDLLWKGLNREGLSVRRRICLFERMGQIFFLTSSLPIRSGNGVGSACREEQKVEEEEKIEDGGWSGAHKGPDGLLALIRHFLTQTAILLGR